jgi:H+/Cl- antiporter ClcA
VLTRDKLDDPGRALLSLHHWKARIVLWTAGAAVGGCAVLFAWLADAAQALFRHVVAASGWWPWLLAPLGFMGVAWVTRRYFRGTEGSGIPQAIFALRPEAGEGAQSLLHPRIIAGRMLLAAVVLLSGGSIGREGPSVHVGAVVAHGFARWLPEGGTIAQRRALVLAGGAAGVAAAFNTPLAGIVFGIEELARSFEERASGVALTAVILAGVIAIALNGDHSYFGQPAVSGLVRAVSPGTFLVAILGGLAGGLFSRMLLLAVRGLPSLVGRLQREWPVVFAALCGLVVAAVGTLCGGLTYGTGYTEARSILESNAHLPWIYAPGRALATLAAFLSGVPAGLLAPSLSVGAGLGQAVADLVHQSTAVPYAILGMCAYLAGVTQAPLTSFIIVMEMTTQHAMVLPLMITAAVATGISRLLSPPLYQALANRYAGVPPRAPEPLRAEPSVPES